MALRTPAVGDEARSVEGQPHDALVGACEGGRFGVYLDAQRAAKGMRANDRAAVLSARLGYPDRRWLAELRGDALVVGVDTRGGDCDVQAGVLVAACQGAVAVTLEMDPAGCLR